MEKVGRREVEEKKKKKPKRTTNPGGEDGMGLYLDYRTRYHPLPSDGDKPINIDFWRGMNQITY